MPYSNKEKAREYNRLYHLKNWASRKAQHQDAKRKRRILLSEWLKTYKKDLFCIKCNEAHPACLDFHHIDRQEKEGTVSNMISQGYSIERIQKEINKCITFCKNCHAKEHYSRNHLIENISS